jgi:hypothetical protein
VFFWLIVKVIKIAVVKLTPLPKSIIEKIDDFEDESDFFGLIQIGLFRENNINLDDFTKIVINLILKVFNPDRVKIALEMNYKGDMFYEKLISKDDFYDEQISKQDLLVIASLLDRDVRNWEHRRIRDKLMGPYLNL